MPVKEHLLVHEKPIQEQWYWAETPDRPSIRLRRERGGHEAAFALVLSGLAPRSSRGEPCAGPPTMQDGQVIEVVHHASRGQFHCLVQGRAHARRAENALESADALWRNLEVSWGGEAAHYRFVPSDVPSHLDGTWGCWRAVIHPAGLRIPVRRPIGYLAGASNGDLILPHPAVRPILYFNALAGVAVTLSAPVEVRLSLRAFSLPGPARRVLQLALQGEEMPQWLEGSDAVPASAQGLQLLEALRLDLEQWCHHPFGYQVTCTVLAAEPVPDTLLARIGREIFHGRPVRLTAVSRKSRSNAAVRQPLDLRRAIPMTGAMPPLFPAREVLMQKGVPVQYSEVPPGLAEEGQRLGHVGRPGRGREVRFAVSDRTRHCYVLGATGSGKSTLLYNMLRQDIESGAGACLLDPHGDLYHQVSDTLPFSRVNDVILIEPGGDRAVGLNFLECRGPYPQTERNFIANEMIKIFDRLYDLRVTGGPMFEMYMRNALLLVMDNEIGGGTLMDIPLLFEDDRYRCRLIDHCRSAQTVNFWRGQAERAGGDVSLQNMAPYVTSKLNQFTCNALVRPIIGQSQSTVDFRECMDSGRIVLVNLSKGRLGELDTRLLGMLIIGKLFNAALQRVNVPASKRRPFFLYIDEAQNFTTDTVAHLLAEARKFGLYLTLANQTLSQVCGSNLLEAILGNVGSLLLFRLGAPDAEKMAVYTRPELGPRDLEDLADHHAAARLLVQGRPLRPFVFQTLAPQDNSAETESVRKVLQANRTAYTRPVPKVEQEIRARREDV